MKKYLFIAALALASCADVEDVLTPPVSSSDALTGSTWETEDSKAMLVFSADQKVNSIILGVDGKTENTAGTYSYEDPFIRIYPDVESGITRYGTIQGAKMLFASENAIYTRK